LSSDNALANQEQTSTLETALSKDQNKQPKVHVVTRGVVATMAVHDSATGTIHRHLVRKVRILYRLYTGDCIGCSKKTTTREVPPDVQMYFYVSEFWK
jgi:hypothetical protein